MDAHLELKAIGPTAELTPAETVERVQLSALIAEQRNDYPAGARSICSNLRARNGRAIRRWLLPVHLKLAQTFIKLGDNKQALAHADKVLQSEGGETPLPEKIVAGALNVKAEAQ